LILTGKELKGSLIELGYPRKLYLYIVLFIATLIAMNYVTETRLPSGGRPPYLFLIWNTFLAWIPVGIAIIIDSVSLLKRSFFKTMLYAGFGLSWLFFYPNAAYLITDMLHPFARYKIQGRDFWHETLFWDHLFTLFLVAILGLALGNAALSSLHGLVRRRYGSWVAWGFVVIVLALGSVGVYLGRFNRWNTWDIIDRPGHILRDTAELFINLEQLKHTLAFCKWIFVITLISYVIMYLSGVRKSPRV
jgi:uncharacterized membrane protein